MAGRCRQTPLINANALPFSPPHGRREDPRAGTSTANHRARRAASAEPSYFRLSQPFLPQRAPACTCTSIPPPIVFLFTSIVFCIASTQYSTARGHRPERDRSAAKSQSRYSQPVLTHHSDPDFQPLADHSTAFCSVPHLCFA